jgi:iron(III) transport system ATP-binding protein
VRPEQIRLDALPDGGVTATVESYEYFGHDAVVRVRPVPAELPDLVVRVTGGRPVEPGRRVGLSVEGPVVAWPLASEAAETPRGPDRSETPENQRTTPS